MSIFNPIYETKKRKGLLGKKKNRKKAYQNYLKTKDWKKRSGQIKQERKKCERCGSGKYLQTHHKTYFRVGGEIAGDLEVVCSTCHKRIHGIM